MPLRLPLSIQGVAAFVLIEGAHEMVGEVSAGGGDGEKDASAVTGVRFATEQMARLEPVKQFRECAGGQT